MDTIPGWLTILISILTLLGGGVGAWIISIYQAKKQGKLAETKQTSELRMSENEQAFKIYKDLVDNLRQDVTRVSTGMAKLEDDHLKCREEGAALRTENRLNKEELDETKQELKEVKIELFNLKKDLNQ